MSVQSVIRTIGLSLFAWGCTQGNIAIRDIGIPVGTPEDFLEAIQTDSITGTCWELTSDLDFSGLPPVEQAGFHETNAIEVCIDGKGFALRNMVVSLAGSAPIAAGIFYRLGGNSIIRNLTIENISFLQTPTLGGILAGSLLGNTLIENVHIRGQLEGIGNLAGFAGYSQARFFNSSFEGDIKCTLGAFCASIVGSQVTGIMSRVSANATLRGITDIGGLIGFAGSTVVKESLFRGAIIGLDNAIQGTSMGGIAGRASGLHIEDSYVQASIDGRQSLAGAIGWPVSSSVTRFVFMGTITGAPYPSGNNGAIIGWDSTLNLPVPNPSNYVASTNFWDVDLLGWGSSGSVNSSVGVNYAPGAGTGMSTLQLNNPATYQAAGFNLNSIWKIPTDGLSYPSLQWE